MPLTVNGEEITEVDLRLEEERLRAQLREAMPNETSATIEARTIEWARENAIERVLLRQAAMAEPEALPEGAIEAAAAANEGMTSEALDVMLRIERLTRRLTAKLVPPRPKEVSEYYREHRDEYITPELIRVAHIVKNVDEQHSEETVLPQIQAIEEELNEGADFAEVADRLSDCPGRGGDLGFFPRGQMVAEFEAVVFALAPGQRSPIFRTAFGFHIAKVVDRKPAGPRPYDELKNLIANLLFDQKKLRRIEQYIDTLLAKADIRQ
ncbi:MAG: peptidylprolyl isomerase [Candidatus Solibacter sp.]